MVEKGGGKIEVFDVHSGKGKFRTALSRANAKAKTRLVLVAERGAMVAAVGEDSWSEIEAQAEEYVLSDLSNKTSVLNDIADTSSSLSPREHLCMPS